MELAILTLLHPYLIVRLGLRDRSRAGKIRTLLILSSHLRRLTAYPPVTESCQGHGRNADHRVLATKPRDGSPKGQV